MKYKDSSFIKMIGVVGAICVIAALFMNFITMHFRVELEGFDDVTMEYGLSVFQVRSMLDNFKEDFKEGKEARQNYIDELDEVRYELSKIELFEDLSTESYDELIGFYIYAFKEYQPLMITPWILLICGGLLLGFTLFSIRWGKLVTIVLLLGCVSVLMINFGELWPIIGMGVWTLGFGIIAGIVSTVASFIEKRRYDYGEYI